MKIRFSIVLLLALAGVVALGLFPAGFGRTKAAAASRGAGSGSVAQSGGAPAAKVVAGAIPAHGRKELEQLPPDQRDSFQQAVFAAMHMIDPLTAGEASLPANNGVSHFTSNPGQRFNARFRRDGGVMLGGGRERSAWQGTLRLVGGKGDGGWETSGTRAEYRRGTVTEWYENRSEGLEHGFVLSARPADATAAGFRLELEMEGLQVEFAPGRYGELVFSNPETGDAVLAYRGLKAWDATGRALDARMLPTVAGLRIAVNDRDAAYPVTVDPMIVSVEAKLSATSKLVASDGVAGDEFGGAVAIDGNLAVVGDRTKDSPTGADTGAVYAFVYDGSRWTQSAKLTAFDAAAGDGLGASVAVSSDVPP